MRRVLLVFLAGCASAPAPKVAIQPSSAPTQIAADETHFAGLEQLTFGGENAEAYWSMDGKQLIFQAHGEGEGCDRIYRMDAATHAVTPVSNGKGATTCAFFLPGDQEVIFASTELGGDKCPPPPDRSQGYVWALYESYDIWKSKPDGSGAVRLTETKGYDAEATVCKVDGSIIFTSVRDGDIDLYRMDKDGKNVKRLTNTKGYDGGAFFSDDCKQIVWRASRPQGKDLEDYERLLGLGLVRPSKLELYVGNADGSEARQVTALGAASFGPYFFPDGKRIIFSSNYGDPKGREFDLWAVNTDGTQLERITHAPGFDGFPMFSADGKQLVFASNRATAPGKGDTNLFLAKWQAGSPKYVARPEDSLKETVAWLADPAREGRGMGTAGLAAAADFIFARFSRLGIAVSRHGFDAVTSMSLAAPVEATVAGKALSRVAPLAMSESASVSAPVVAVGYGIVAPELSHDDYKGKNVKGKIVLVRRFVPSTFTTVDAERRYGDLRKKAFEAKQRGAIAVIVADAPEIAKGAAGKGAGSGAGAEVPKEAPFPEGALEAGKSVDAASSAGLPVVMIGRDDYAGLDGKTLKLTVKIEAQKSRAENIVARLVPQTGAELPPLVIGAHYDHLGLGGRDSLAPGEKVPHVGADDNASGVAALIAVAEVLTAVQAMVGREIIFIAFSGEELGVLGSTAWVRDNGAKKPLAMLNMDMVGRLRNNALTILGGESAEEWSAMLSERCTALKLSCAINGDGYGPSDQTPFFGAGSPVLHFFTGAHSEYHKPSDTADRLNYSGLARIAVLVAETALQASKADTKLTYKPRAAQAAPMFGDRRSFGASLGTVPDYAGPPPGTKGVLLSGVRTDSAAEKAGMKRGDVLVKLGRFDIATVEDLMFALTSSKPGETVKARVLRDGRETELSATFEERRAR